MRTAIGSDHAGYELKSLLIPYLQAKGHEIRDLGTDSAAMVDYPSFCAAVARAVVRGEADKGIVVGGSGQGEQIAANKIRGARAALCHDEWTARFARRHNDANILALGGRLLGEVLALAIVDVFFEEGFEGGRHKRRLAQIAEIEEQESDR